MQKHGISPPVPGTVPQTGGAPPAQVNVQSGQVVEPAQPAADPDGGAQTLLDALHGWPGEQQVRLAPVPQGVVPAGQPQVPVVLSTHATPASQQVGPHGVVPEGQQQRLAGFEQVPEQHAVSPLAVVPHWVWPDGQPHLPVRALRHATPALQQLGPHGVVPARQLVAASARKGRRTVAPAAAAAAAPTTLRMPRRLGWAETARVKSSNVSLMGRPPTLPDTDCLPVPRARPPNPVV
jgi:hypothetical protein